LHRALPLGIAAAIEAACVDPPPEEALNHCRFARQPTAPGAQRGVSFSSNAEPTGYPSVEVLELRSRGAGREGTSIGHRPAEGIEQRHRTAR
jgi:hypothetical protein